MMYGWKKITGSLSKRNFSYLQINLFKLYTCSGESKLCFIDDFSVDVQTSLRIKYNFNGRDFTLKIKQSQ